MGVFNVSMVVVFTCAVVKRYNIYIYKQKNHNKNVNTILILYNRHQYVRSGDRRPRTFVLPRLQLGRRYWYKGNSSTMVSSALLLMSERSLTYVLLLRLGSSSQEHITTTINDRISISIVKYIFN